MGTDDANDDADFAPRVDARAAVTSLVVGAAFFIVNRRVAGAVEARRRREALEEERREISLRRLSGTASSDDLDACLLYTSPSPRDGLLSRMPSSA